MPAKVEEVETRKLHVLQQAIARSKEKENGQTQAAAPAPTSAEEAAAATNNNDNTSQKRVLAVGVRVGGVAVQNPKGSVARTTPPPPSLRPPQLQLNQAGGTEATDSADGNNISQRVREPRRREAGGRQMAWTPQNRGSETS